MYIQLNLVSALFINQKNASFTFDWLIHDSCIPPPSPPPLLQYSIVLWKARPVGPTLRMVQSKVKEWLL